MKALKKAGFVFAVAVALAAFSIFDISFAQETQPGKAIVRKVVGTAQSSKGEGVWARIRLNDRLGRGTTIMADAESQVDLFLGWNGPTLRVTADTSVAMDALSLAGGGEDVVIETKLNLVDGRFLGNANKLAAASIYQVKTPTGFARIREADYDISARKNAAGKFEATYKRLRGQITGVDKAKAFSLGDGQGFQAGRVFSFPAEITPLGPPPEPAPAAPPPNFITHISPVPGRRSR